MLSGLNSGTLYKRGPKVKDAFKKRFFILFETTLRYYDDDKGSKLCGSIELAKVRSLSPTGNQNAGPKEFPRVKKKSIVLLGCLIGGGLFFFFFFF